MKTLFKLMDLKTLVAGLIPVIFGSIYSLYRYNEFSIVDMVVIMIGIVLLQSCTNMINDLYDHKRGADGDLKVDEKALASGDVSVKQVKHIIYTFLSIDIVIALYYSFVNHFAIFIIALIAVFIMYKYSAGQKPISYTPFGELVAGSTMGFGIMTTVIFIQSGYVNVETFMVALPTSIFIGTILLTNNISDHEADEAVGRRTLPIIIGIKKAEWLWIANCFSLLGLTCLFVAYGLFPLESLFLTVLLLPYKQIIGFRNIEKRPTNKGIMMGLIGKVGLRFHLGIMVGIIVSMYV